MFENVSPRKKQLYFVAAELFAEHGYENTSLDEIASRVGIKKPSIFAHFKSKRAILDELYILYETERKRILPDLDELLKLVENEPPLELLLKSRYHFAPDIEPFMNCIVSTAASMMSTDAESQRFISDNVLNAPQEHVKPLLYKMIELNMIEKFDVEIFCEIIRDYCFASIAYIATPMSLDRATFKEKLCYLFRTHIKPT